MEACISGESHATFCKVMQERMEEEDFLALRYTREGGIDEYATQRRGFLL